MTPTTPTTRSQPGPGLGPSAGSAATAQPTHACVRCGAAVAIDTALCEECNPLGLSQPASSQVHGIALGGVATGVIALALIARLSISGIGPFEGSVVDVKASGDSLAITLTVVNNGTNTGQATCRVTDPAARFGGASAYVLTPRIDPGATLTFDADIRQLGSVPRVLLAECTGP